MNTLQLFTYNDQNVRTVTVDGDTWFVASDVAKILGYRMASDMTRRLRSEDKGTRSVRTLRGDQKMTVISKPGLFRSILRSEVEGALMFQYWVTHEVLPSIDGTGSYCVAAPAPLDLSSISRRQLAEAIIAEANRADAAEEQLAIVAPKVEAFETFMGAQNDWDVRDAAQMLQNQHGIEIGQNLLFQWLRDNGWIGEDNRAYQTKLRQKLLRMKASTFVVKYVEGEPVFADPQVRVTPKGLERLRQLLSAKQAIPQLTAKQPVRAIAEAPKRKWQTLNP